MFAILTVDAVEALPDTRWLVEGVLPATSVVVLFGQPGCGKSFVALSIALSCAAGQGWLDRKTSVCNVLYIAAEGILGMKKRLQAYRRRKGVRAERVRLIARDIQLANETHRNSLLQALLVSQFTPDLIIIDTLARSAEGIDENSAKEMGQVVAGIEHLKNETSATILVVHHTSKGGSSERGSSALRGASDVMILCEAGGGSDLRVTLTCEKMKDDEPFNQIGATLEKVALPGGSSSLVVGEACDVFASSGEAADAIVEILQTQFAEVGAKHALLKAAYEAKTGKSKSTFDRAFRDLKQTDRVSVEGEGRGAIYRAVGISVRSVSNECQIQTQVSVMSPPTIGGDTDTKS